MLDKLFSSNRAKRNITDYTRSGEVSGAEAEELVKEAEKFSKIVLEWLRDNNFIPLSRCGRGKARVE